MSRLVHMDKPWGELERQNVKKQVVLSITCCITARNEKYVVVSYVYYLRWTGDGEKEKVDFFSLTCSNLCCFPQRAYAIPIQPKCRQENKWKLYLGRL